MKLKYKFREIFYTQLTVVNYLFFFLLEKTKGVLLLSKNYSYWARIVAITIATCSKSKFRQKVGRRGEFMYVYSHNYEEPDILKS